MVQVTDEQYWGIANNSYKDKNLEIQKIKDENKMKVTNG